MLPRLRPDDAAIACRGSCSDGDRGNVPIGEVGVPLLKVMGPYHTPVMAQEALETLQIRPQGSYIDCNLGEGGHSLAILRSVSPTPRLLGIDLDPEAVDSAKQRLEAYHDKAVLVQGNFADLDIFTKKYRFTPVDGILFDLGLSSLQLDAEGRGFSFRREARLDMRFDPSQDITAHQMVNEFSERSLADIIFRLGEEPKSRRIARAIVSNRPIETTIQLAGVVARATRWSSRSRVHPATRTFQAIRMAVNAELDNLERGLQKSIEVLGIGGRVAVISYHSLEDRLVKNTFRRESKDCVCPPRTLMCVCGHKATVRLVNRRVIKPKHAEVRANPRSRSARMRVAERI